VQSEKRECKKALPKLARTDATGTEASAAALVIKSSAIRFVDDICQERTSSAKRKIKQKGFAQLA
jgi:hypothetical protein